MSSNFKTFEGEVRNKNGKVIEKYINFQPKKGFVNIKDINKMYNKLKADIDPKKMMIKVQTKTASITAKPRKPEHDGKPHYITAKHYEHIDDDLNILVENYYSSLSKEGQDKFKDLLSFQIIMKV